MRKLNIKSRQFILILGISIALFLGLFLFVQSPLFKVTLATKETHLEAGKKAETNPAFYLDGPDWCIPFSYVDTSSVTYTKVGRYPVYLYHGFQKLTSYVNVVDTTAPTVKCEIKNITVIPGETLSVQKLGLKIQDFSEISSMKFSKIASTNFYTGLPDEDTVDMREAYRQGIPMEAEEFQFAFGGIYTMTISVSDAFYNTSEIDLTIKVESAPVLEIPKNFYVVKENEVIFREYINVWDFVTEDMSIEDIQIDSSQLNLSSTGTYPVVFSATDDYGLTATQTSAVHICTQNALQELINTHAIDFSTSVIIGAKNPYDSGYYTTEDIGFIQNKMLPSIIHITNDTLGSFGSGFIIEINEEFVTIATNEHVIRSDLTVDITFFDGTKCSGAVVAASKERDIAFVRIPIKDTNSASALSKEYVKTLRTVHINKSYWDGLSQNCNITIGYNCINSDGAIWQTATGKILEKEATRDWNQYKNVTETILSMTPVSGISGSALFDGYGHLIGMMRGYTEYDKYRETVAVPLSQLLEYFEIIFKYKIHYQ